MNYYVARNGQQYGPYAEETVRQYLAAGSLSAADHVRGEAAQSWQTIGELFGQRPATAPPTVPIMPPVYQQSYQQPAYPAQVYPQPAYPAAAPVAASSYQGLIIPPDLHWFVVLLLSITWIFPFIWAFVMAGYAKKINSTSKAGVLYGFWFVCWIIYLILIVAAQAAGSEMDSDAAAGFAAMIFFVLIAGVVLCIVGNFSIRRSMLTYYNSVEPIRLNLSGGMTFFFGILYLQYHMSRIARWKKTGVLTA
jgi:hypothetical protein